MKPADFGIEDVTDEDLVYHGSRFSDRARRFSPTPTKTSGAAMASRPCRITK
jgi:hypothetical protein